jgi:hypothetical protein
MCLSSKGNANQNDIEIPSHEENNQKQMLVRMGGWGGWGRKPHTLLEER